MFNVSTVLLQNAFETTSSFTDVWRLQDFPSRLAAYQVATMRNVSFCFKQTVDGLCLTVFQYTAAVDFIQQPVTPGCTDWFCSTFYAEIPVVVER